MPRKRMIDPEFWSDEEIGKWSHTARLFYIALWNFADDEGRFKAHPSLLKSQIFPYDKSVNIEKLKSEISDKIKWYKCNDSIYGYIQNFLKYQRIDRPSASKLPNHEQFDECSTSVRKPLDPNIREVKLRKEKLMIIFEDLWEKYPINRKIGKEKARVQYVDTVITDKDVEDIKLALNSYNTYIEKNRVEENYIKHGSTWFNNWRDYIPKTPRVKNKAEAAAEVKRIMGD